MSDVQSCLAVLAVTAGANGIEAKPMVIDTIERFVDAGPQDPAAAVERLEELKAGFAALKLDGALAVTIAAAIERRISLFTVGVPSTDGAAIDDSARAQPK